MANYNQSETLDSDDLDYLYDSFQKNNEDSYSPDEKFVNLCNEAFQNTTLSEFSSPFLENTNTRSEKFLTCDENSLNLAKLDDWIFNSVLDLSLLDMNKVMKLPGLFSNDLCFDPSIPVKENVDITKINSSTKIKPQQIKPYRKPIKPIKKNTSISQLSSKFRKPETPLSISIPQKYSVANSTAFPLKCLWATPSCNLLFQNSSSLYDHVVKEHIGRKSTKNQCLTCHWDSCGKLFSKRDHIISHMKKHVELKLYSCDKCNKSYKHLHDLRKHSKKCNEFEEVVFLNDFSNELSDFKKNYHRDIKTTLPFYATQGIWQSIPVTTSNISTPREIGRYIATHDYTRTADFDLSVQIGDNLDVEAWFDDSFCLATDLRTGDNGIINIAFISQESITKENLSKVIQTTQITELIGVDTTALSVNPDDEGAWNLLSDVKNSRKLKEISELALNIIPSSQMSVKPTVQSSSSTGTIFAPPPYDSANISPPPTSFDIFAPPAYDLASTTNVTQNLPSYQAVATQNQVYQSVPALAAVPPFEPPPYQPPVSRSQTKSTSVSSTSFPRRMTQVLTPKQFFSTFQSSSSTVISIPNTVSSILTNEQESKFLGEISVVDPRHVDVPLCMQLFGDRFRVWLVHTQTTRDLVAEVILAAVCVLDTGEKGKQRGEGHTLVRMLGPPFGCQCGTQFAKFADIVLHRNVTCAGDLAVQLDFWVPIWWRERLIETAVRAGAVIV